MQFMEAFNYAKKVKATLRLPGKNYVFAPHEDNSISVKDYNGNILQEIEIKDSQEFIKIACQFSTDDWMLCGFDGYNKSRKLISFEDALKELKSGKCIARFNSSWDGVYLSIKPSVPILAMDEMKDKCSEDIIKLLYCEQIVAYDISSDMEYNDHYKFTFDDIMAHDWFVLF